MDIKAITLAEVEKLQYEMNKVLGHMHLHLVNVEEGCVKFVFRCLIDNKLTISKDQEKALIALGVISIAYGNETIWAQTAKILKRDEKVHGK